MSLHYLLDGYNIIKQAPELAQKKLEDGRNGLIRMIEIYQPQGSLNNRVTIVFDGQPGMWGQASVPTVNVIFTETGSADDKIKSLVEDSRLKKNIVVVSDDKDIKFAVRPLGATVMGVKEFLSKCRPRSTSTKFSSKKIKMRVKEEEKSISKSLEYKITSEFERIWLDKRDQKKKYT